MNGTPAKWNDQLHDPRVSNIRQAEKQSSATVFTVGLLLSLTGIGAIVGVPMILHSVFGNKRPDIEPTGAWEADCPHCARAIVFVVPDEQPAFRCPLCVGAVELRDERLIKTSHAPTKSILGLPLNGTR